VLVDLENLARVDGGWLTEQALADILTHALALAGSADFRLAVAPRAVLKRYAKTLAALHLPCEVVAPGPDAADLVLLAHAAHLTTVGYDHFVVLSGDHIFATIDRPITVIVRDGQPVARALRQSAAAVLAA
jgi:hypothetical protein